MLDTIAAVATPPGRGGVGIIRISGPRARQIGLALCRDGVNELTPRHALYTPFLDVSGQQIDEGLLLYFPGPNSFTGEDVVELQGHGGPVVLDLLLQTVLARGARLARAGEFSERAFLNDKIDLAQAEAIADLIDAGSAEAARAALGSLQGVFSQRINDLVEALIHLRLHVEAAIDFPEEEIDFLADGVIVAECQALLSQTEAVLQEAGQGVILREGMKVVIAGLPNAGKSSLLNQLAGQDVAIVTDIAGTTRDVLRQHIQIDGMPLHVIDTAGLRESPDVVEREGIRRARLEIEQADRVLFVWDASLPDACPEQQLLAHFGSLPERMTLIANKCDRRGQPAMLTRLALAGVEYPCIVLSASRGEGMDLLRQHLKDCMGFNQSGGGQFSARRRHLDALTRTLTCLRNALVMLSEHRAGELAAEDLRLAQQALSEITGEFSPDDLLGRIFSSFCIGK